MAGNNDEQNERKEAVAREIEKLRQRGDSFSPVVCQKAKGHLCSTFWGQAWCRNLELYSDYEYRLPKGRSYLRKGHVYNLVITEGAVEAYVTGSEIYEVIIRIEMLADSRWQEIKQSSSGQITSLAELLSGRLTDEVLRLITDRERGLFPTPAEITFDCNCPDWADMCKHVAAVLYGVGVRLDSEPTLFFTLRGVDHHEMIGAAREAAARGDHLSTDDPSAGVLHPDELSALFGIDLGQPDAAFGD